MNREDSPSGDRRYGNNTSLAMPPFFLGKIVIFFIIFFTQAGSLQKIPSPNSITFEETDIFIFLKVRVILLLNLLRLFLTNFNIFNLLRVLVIINLTPQEPLHGPILHEVYLWLGRRASELSVSSAHQHCQQLMHCLPGGTPLHKEVW